MAHLVMDAIEVLGVDPADVPHAHGETVVDGFQEQAAVITHKAESITSWDVSGMNSTPETRLIVSGKKAGSEKRSRGE